jgi:hypothetical protein
VTRYSAYGYGQKAYVNDLATEAEAKEWCEGYHFLTGQKAVWFVGDADEPFGRRLLGEVGKSWAEVNGG